MFGSIVLFYWLHTQAGQPESSSFTCHMVSRTGSNVISPVQDVSYESEGFYSCVAGNTLGETISTAYLELAGNIITSESRKEMIL